MSQLQPASVTMRIRQLLSPTERARTNAARALHSLTNADGRAAHLDAADRALLTGHPAGSARRSNGRLATPLWDAFPGQVALLDRDSTVISVNSAWRRFALEHGGNATTGLGLRYLDVCARAAADGEPVAARAQALVETALKGAAGDRLVYPVPGGESLRWFALRALPLPGGHSGVLVLHEDVTAETVREQELRHAATHDPLTGLPNRALITDRLVHATARAERDGSRLAVLFIDLDSFKQVNDTVGHDVGDAVLRAAAQRLNGSLRTADTLGRWGGDEFLVVAEALPTPRAATGLARRLTGALSTPLPVQPHPVTVGATVGLTHYRPGEHPDRLIHAADLALRRKRARTRVGRSGR